jgi:hypothetical protein
LVAGFCGGKTRGGGGGGWGLLVLCASLELCWALFHVRQICRAEKFFGTRAFLQLPLEHATGLPASKQSSFFLAPGRFMVIVGDALTFALHIFCKL